MENIKKTIVEISASIETAKSELKELCLDEKYPLGERVSLFDKAPSYLKEHSRYGADNCPLLEAKLYDGDYQRYRTVKSSVFLEPIQSFQGYLKKIGSLYLVESITEDEFEIIPRSYEYYETHQDLLEDLKIVKEILTAQLGSAVVDW